MDRKLHLTDNSSRQHKVYRIKAVTDKFQKMKKKDTSAAAAVSQIDVYKAAKQSEQYDSYQKNKSDKSSSNKALSHSKDAASNADALKKHAMYNAYQQKAAELNQKLSSDVKISTETVSKVTDTVAEPKYSDNTKNAASLLAARLSADVSRSTHSNRTENTSLNSPPGNSKTVNKMQKTIFYLNSNQMEKAQLMKPSIETQRRFRKAVERNALKYDEEYARLDNAIALQYHKLYKLQEKRIKLDKQASSTHIPIVKNAEKAIYLGSKVVSAANKNTIGEASASIAAIPVELAAKKLYEKAAEKHLALEKAEKLAAASIKVAASVESEESVGAASSAAVTAIPKYYISQKAEKKVTDAIHNHHDNSIDRKRAALRARQEKAEKKAEQLKKEQAQRAMKVNLYKAEHGIYSKSATAVQNAKAAVKAAETAKTAFKIKSSAAIVAAAGGLAIPILAVLVILIVIIILFSWMSPHKMDRYDEENETFVTVELTEEKEILEGYLEYIQQYFDKKQLEILEIVDYDFGGFEPDKYTYKDYIEHNEIRQWNYTKTYATVEQTTTNDYLWSDGHGNGGSGTTTETKSYTFDLCQRSYYRYDEKHGEQQVMSTEAEFSRLQMLNSLNIEGYYQYLYNENPIKNQLYTFENGVLSSWQDITDVTITQYDAAGNTVMISSAEDFLKSEIVKDVILWQYYPTEITKEPNSTITVSSEVTAIISQDTPPENQIEKTYEMKDDHIWNLYEYGNKWIKLSDNCDFEHIIAMAAVMKWQEISSNTIDTNTYKFEITDADLEKCIGNVCEIYYSYRIGPCAFEDCCRIGDPEDLNVTYYCNRPTTHKHLIGQVTNYEYSYGVDYVLSKILKVPVAAHYPQGDKDPAYKEAVEVYAQNCDIYEVYCEYIASVLGTSTKLDDYENDPKARQRLKDMYDKKYGVPPDAPLNVRCSVETKDNVNYLHVSWTPPASSDVTGYRVYAYIRPAHGSNYKPIAMWTDTTTGTSSTLNCGSTTLPQNVYVVVTAYNDLGETPEQPHNLTDDSVAVYLPKTE